MGIAHEENEDIIIFDCRISPTEILTTDFRFRWDYFDKYHEKTGGELTGFQKFMDSGVRAQYLESVFPAESFPAWQTIQTG